MRDISCRTEEGPCMEKTPPPPPHCMWGKLISTLVFVYIRINLEKGKARVGEVFPNLLKKKMSLPSHATIRRTTEPIASQTYGMNNPR